MERKIHVASDPPAIFRHHLFSSLVASFAMACTPVALACSPIKSIGVLFDRNSATMRADQVARLAEWTSMLKAKYPNREAIFMTTQAEFGERNPSSLGMDRAMNVAAVLKDTLQFSVPKVELPAKAFAAAVPVHGEDGLRVKRVDIDFLPACPHECPCQLGDPLYVPLKQ